jgi:ribose/xylose/arabinose/galactoside ABC-type transport system permease subunit
MFEKIVSQRYFVVLILTILMMSIFAITQEAFLSIGNLKVIIASSSILWMVSMGLTFVMISGGFDLSIGSMLALTGIGFGWFINQLNLNVWLAIIATLILGLILGGLINGFLIGRFNLSFLVVTLGSSILYSGFTNFWSKTKTTQVTSPVLEKIAYGNIGIFPVQMILMVLVFFVFLYVQKFTFFGRDVYAIGGNTEAARLSGIDTRKIIISVYGISGFFAAFAGIIQDARIQAASPQVGANLIFTATAAVLLGGTSFSGGLGGVGGTVVGVLFLGILQNGLAVAGLADYWQQVITGSILIGAIGLDYFQRSRNISRSKSKIANLLDKDNV